ncbi:uncharacterized protein LOC112488968 [Ziziphus jujuba]|uniref:Uncharacterized protein LOC112488968 n=1 Tax=Ziziphus jujuba TaxID=326968 RepID=A0ABM3ZWH0_ZIZJJ|nr:uncharacterized protein LOC112488968 [Ziziphus jujuba]
MYHQRHHRQAQTTHMRYCPLWAGPAQFCSSRPQNNGGSQEKASQGKGIHTHLYGMLRSPFQPMWDVTIILVRCRKFKKTADHTKWVGAFHQKQDFIDVVEAIFKGAMTRKLIVNCFLPPERIPKYQLLHEDV